MRRCTGAAGRGSAGAATDRRALLGAGAALTAIALCVPASASAAGSASPAAPVAGTSEWPLDAGHFDAARVWPLSTGAGVTVAVVDTGVSATDPDLRGQVLPGVDLTNRAADGQVDTSSDSHGTSVAGVIAADGASGGGTRMTGLAPGAKILPVRIADSSDAVAPATTAQGIAYASTHGARIINLSLGTPLDEPQIRDAVTYALDHGVIVVAAVGNSGQSGNQPMYPASIPGVLAVAGSTPDKSIWTQGESGSYVSIAAPAQDIYSTDDSGGYLNSAGTSYSAPYVSAAAALVWAKYPQETAGQIIARLIETADPVGGGHGRGDQAGFGIVDPYRALTAAAPVSTVNPLLADSPVPVAAAAPKRSAGHGLLIWISAGAAVLVLLLAGTWWWLRRRAREREAAAAQPKSKPASKSSKVKGAR